MWGACYIQLVRKYVLPEKCGVAERWALLQVSSCGLGQLLAVLGL